MTRMDSVVSRGSMKPAPRPTRIDSPARPIASINLGEVVQIGFLRSVILFPKR